MKDKEVIDAVAIRILDLGLKGEYSYNTNEPLTDKQKNLKRDVKNVLTKWFSEETRKTSVRVIQDAFINMDCNTELRIENKTLKKKLELHENSERNYKEYTNTVYRDELREQLWKELDQDREEALESSRRVNRKLMDTMAQLEKKSKKADDAVSRAEWNDLRELNIQLNTQVVEMRKKVAGNKRAEEILKIMKMVNSSSLDSLDSLDSTQSSNITEEVYDLDA